MRAWRRLAVGLTLALAAVSVAGAQDDAFVVIKAGKVITVSGDEFSPGMLVIRGGKIEAVGKKIEIPAGAKVFDVPDAVVMPGLVNPRSRFGLRRYRRSGNNADRSVVPELFPRDGDYEEVLRAGFVALGLIPAGSGIPGSAVAIRPVDGPRDAIVIGGSGYLRITHSALPGDKRTLVGVFKAADKAIEREAKAKKAFEAKAKAKAEAAKAAKAAKAGARKKPAGPAPRTPPPTPPKRFGPRAPKAPPRAPAKATAKPKKPAVFKPPSISPKLQPFVDLVRKPKAAPRLLIEFGRARDLVHFDDALKKRELTPMFFLANAATNDLFHAVVRLGEARAPVLIYPRVTYEPYTRTRRNLPAELARAGAQLAFLPDTDDVKGLRMHLGAVGYLVREGLSRSVALKAVTVVPAALLGLDHEMGTLEKGRGADLIFLDGDPFEAGVRVTRVMIAGESVWSKDGTP